MKKEEDTVTRIGKDFDNEIIEIQEERKKSKIDARKTSKVKLTNKLIKHKHWRKIKADLINFQFKKNKKALATMDIMWFLFFAFLFVIFLGVAVFSFNLITTSLSIDAQLGQVNLEDVTDATLGQINTGFLNNADFMAAGVIFGMILAMMGNAYFFGRKYHRLWIIVDIVILVFAYILAVYLANAYEILINASTQFSVYLDHLPKISSFLLNLNRWVAVIGGIIMLLTYVNFLRGKDELQVGEIGEFR